MKAIAIFRKGPSREVNIELTEKGKLHLDTFNTGQTVMILPKYIEVLSGFIGHNDKQKIVKYEIDVEE